MKILTVLASLTLLVFFLFFLKQCNFYGHLLRKIFKGEEREEESDHERTRASPPWKRQDLEMSK